MEAFPAFGKPFQQPFLLNIERATFQRTWLVGFERLALGFALLTAVPAGASLARPGRKRWGRQENQESDEGMERSPNGSRSVQGFHE